MQTVYPRVCGGTIERPLSVRRSSGLSPRVRGNRRSSPRTKRPPRSIPACAGEPAAAESATSRAEVYPRVCGGTGAGIIRRPGSAGLSPRVRGNRRRWRGVSQSGRSIPACAGEPRISPSGSNAPKVYPRVCGGTDLCGMLAKLAGGLSPRVRGNRLLPGQADTATGSIPACAGEPQQ